MLPDEDAQPQAFFPRLGEPVNGPEADLNGKTFPVGHNDVGFGCPAFLGHGEDV